LCQEAWDLDCQAVYSRAEKTARELAAILSVSPYFLYQESCPTACRDPLSRGFSFADIGLGRYTEVPLRVPEWRNWQTRGTQNPERRKSRVGSIPTSGTNIPIFS
jgi:hypothetical protein